MSYLLFLFWLIILSWSLTKIKFIKNAGLSSKIIIGLFICKVLVGLLAGKLMYERRVPVDTWAYHREGLIQYELLQSNPKEYFTDIFYSPYKDKYGGIFKAGNSYWNDLKLNAIAKFLSVLNIFSFGNYYVNVVLFNFLIFFGYIALFRYFKKAFTASDIINAAVVFLLPSTLFYTSEIHKEGLILSSLGFIMYILTNVLESKTAKVAALFILLFSFVIVFAFRVYILLAFLPAFIALIISTKQKFNTILVFAIVYSLSIAAFFGISKFVSSVNLPEVIVAKKTEFNDLGFANTKIQTPELSATFVSFLKNVPAAFVNGTLRPFFTDMSLSKMLLPFSMELFVYELLVLYFLFSRKKKILKINLPHFLFGICFGLSLCLLTGYITPILGATVRYKSIYLPFIMAPIIFYSNLSFLKSKFNIKK